MTEKEIRVRTLQKHDYEINWLKAVNFIPKKGEIIIYDVEVDNDGNILTFENGEPVFIAGQGQEGAERHHPLTQSKQKIGDGIHNVNDLPFSTPSIWAGEGIDSLILGEKYDDIICTGQDAVAMGHFAEASGHYALALGNRQTASGSNSFAQGMPIKKSDGSVVGNTASGDGAFAVGEGNLASG
jgi:hypothetical protein